MNGIQDRKCVEESATYSPNDYVASRDANSRDRDCLKFKQMAEETALTVWVHEWKTGNHKGALAFVDTDIVVQVRLVYIIFHIKS